MIDVAILSCNRARITSVSLEQIHRRTTTPHRLIVLDNGSVDESPQVLEDYEEAGWIDELILHEENWGVHWGFDRLLEEIETERYVCADNDLVPQSPRGGVDWLEMLAGLMDERPDYAAIAGRCHVHIGQPRNLFEDAPEVLEMSHVGASLRLMRTEVVREVGGWRDTKEPSRDNEEHWICGRLRRAGWKVGFARDVCSIHLWGEEERGEDPWGYDLERFPNPEDHGHREIWPPVNHFSWRRMGLDWHTCREER